MVGRRRWGRRPSDRSAPGQAPRMSRRVLAELVVAASLAAFVVALAAPASGQFVAPEGSSFRNGSTLLRADEGEASRLLASFEEALVLGQGQEAAYLLGVLRRRPGDDLVRFGPRTHVPALERAARLLMASDDAALRRDVLAREAAAVADARRRRDVELLLDHATRGLSLPTAREAAWIAARLLYEQGRVWEAGALAARLPEAAGARAVVTAAASHEPPGQPEPTNGPWSYALSFRERLNHHPSAPVPLVLDGRPGELLLLDSEGLVAIDVAGSRKSHPDYDWRARVLGMGGFVLGLPLPRQISVARSGSRLVLPFNVTAESTIRWRGPPARREPALIALDLGGEPEQQPRLAWRAVPGLSDRSAALGPPTIAGDRVFSQLFRVGLEAEVSLCAFSLATGALLFETPLARGAFVPRFASRRAEVDEADLDKRAREGAPAVVDGMLYVCTGVGVVAAVDGITGRVLHSFRYDRLVSLDKSVYDPAYLFDTGGWEHEPVRVFGERVVVAPSDSRFLYMLAREPGPAGQLILEDPIERLDRRRILDLLPDPQGGEAPLVLATRHRDQRDGLVLLSPMGHTLAVSVPLPEGESFSGAASRLGSVVLQPTTAGVRLWDGNAIERAPALLPRFDGLPPPAAAYPLALGLVVLHPDPDGVLDAVYWKPLR